MMARCIELLQKLFGHSHKPKHPHPPVFFPLIAEAWISIGTNRVRALLAMLGIIIGVGSVVLMVAIGSGSQKKVEEAIHALGNNILIIMPGGNQQQGLRVNFQQVVFTNKDINALAQLPTVEGVAYATFPVQQAVTSYIFNTKTSMVGVIPDYFAIRNWVIEDGNNFTSEDIRLGKRVTIIGSTIAKKLFPDQNPLGQTVSIGDSKLRFLVIGVLQVKGASLEGRDQDDTVFMPATALQTYFSPYSPSPVQTIYVKVPENVSMSDATDDIKETLRQTQKIPESMGDSFMIYNLDAIMKVQADSTAAFSLLLGAIASISLVVGSIGIMNIMLVTVSERTREIGIRKAIGATRQQILIQFLLEAVMIAGIGSIVGLVLGLGGGWSAQYWFNIPIAFSMWSVMMALVMAGGIGIASGLYPAYKAARMEPIEALRAVGA